MLIRFPIVYGHKHIEPQNPESPSESLQYKRENEPHWGWLVWLVRLKSLLGQNATGNFPSVLPILGKQEPHICITE